MTIDSILDAIRSSGGIYSSTTLDHLEFLAAGALDDNDAYVEDITPDMAPFINDSLSYDEFMFLCDYLFPKES